MMPRVCRPLGGCCIMFQRKGAAVATSVYNYASLHQPPVVPVSPSKAAHIPLSAQEMGNNQLITLAAMRNHSARVEVLKRHIMSVDNVDYDKACKTFETIKAVNQRGKIWSIPYTFTIATAVTAAFASFPMIFHLPTVEFFNQWYVTMDVPAARDLETPLEVSIWSWEWMEPVLGQISFFLLCIQYAKRQITNLQTLGTMPKGSNIMMVARAHNLTRRFPQYNANVLQDFSDTDNIVKRGPRRRLWTQFV